MSSAFKPTGEMLRVTDLHAFYGESHILHGIDLQVNRGELVTLLGRNGSGRSTTLKAILGLVGRRTGSIMFNGNEVTRFKRLLGWEAFRIIVCRRRRPTIRIRCNVGRGWSLRIIHEEVGRGGTDPSRLRTEEQTMANREVTRNPDITDIRDREERITKRAVETENR